MMPAAASAAAAAVAGTPAESAMRSVGFADRTKLQETGLLKAFENLIVHTTNDESANHPGLALESLVSAAIDANPTPLAKYWPPSGSPIQLTVGSIAKHALEAWAAKRESDLLERLAREGANPVTWRVCADDEEDAFLACARIKRVKGCKSLVDLPREAAAKLTLRLLIQERKNTKVKGRQGAEYDVSTWLANAFAPTESLVTETQQGMMFGCFLSKMVGNETVVRIIVGMYKRPQLPLLERVIAQVERGSSGTDGGLSPEKWLGMALSMYNMSEPLSARTLALVETAFVLDERKRRKLCDSMRLVVATDDEAELGEPIPESGGVSRFRPGNPERVRKIREHLVFRYPVYFGRPMEKNYRDDRVQEVLGYSTHEMPAVDPKINYGILGLANASVGATSAAHHLSIWVFHLWGVNLETSSTEDYKMFVDPNTNRLRENLYRAAIQTKFRLIEAAARHAGSLSAARGKRLVVRVPAMGLGAYLSMISDPDQQRLAHEIFFEAIAEIADRLHEDFGPTVVLEADLFSMSPDRETIGERAEKMVRDRDGRGGSHVRWNFGAPSGNMYRPEDVPPDGEGALMLVNPWDSNSFVGNGLQYDPTPDGFTVSGYGPGRTMPNTSFLHNWFMCPDLVAADAPSRVWIAVPGVSQA